MRLRLRISLIARMAVSLAVLISITLVIAVILSVFGGMLGVAILGWLYRGLEALAGLPRVSTLAPVPPLLVASVAGLGIVAAIRGWPYVRAWTDEQYLLPPTSPISTAVCVGPLTCLYLVAAEGGAAALAGLSTVPGILVVVAFGVVLALAVTVGEVRRRIEGLRAGVVSESTRIKHVTPGVGATTRRLAQLADVPAPTVHVVDTDRPESFTVGTREDAVVPVSAGLLDTLSDAELEAVLAHEVSHLANGDSRVLGAALAPVLAAAEWIEDDPDRLGDYFWDGVFSLLKIYGQSGVAVLSRGREWCADAGAVELTGSPAALASALRTLDAERGAPETDLREWERSVAVADILPPAEPDISTGPFRTHPPTEEMIERLEMLTRSTESSGS